MTDCVNCGLSDPNEQGKPISTNAPYVPNELCVGDLRFWSPDPSLCENNDQRRQESYAAEILELSGAPLNVYKLLGVHEQNESSMRNAAVAFASSTYPGSPPSNLVSGLSSWKSFTTGVATQTTNVGFLFGFKDKKYIAPTAPNLVKIGCIKIKQSNNANNRVQQVKIEITDGSCKIDSITKSTSGIDPIIKVIGSTIAGTAIFTKIDTVTWRVTFVTNGTSTDFANLTTDKMYVCEVFQGMIPANSYSVNDTIQVVFGYNWKRLQLANLSNDNTENYINFVSPLTMHGFRLTPTFAATDYWEIESLDCQFSPKTNINNIQDLFLGENRDRDYAKEPILLKVQYSPTEGMGDLSRFGWNMLGQYSFVASFPMMVTKLGRPIVVGDIVEVIPETQYDHNLKPIRKFLEVTDSAWAADGYSTAWKPHLIRFTAEQALPSQETRDIFGTINEAKYDTLDEILNLPTNKQVDTTPLTISEEIIAESKNLVPETGTNEGPSPLFPIHGNELGVYIEDGLPKNGETYTEGYEFPKTGLVDGMYHRMLYVGQTGIAPRLYRYSVAKNRWIFLEQDRRGQYSSHKPAVRQILESTKSISMGKNK